MKIELQKFNREFVLVVVVFKRQLISKTSQKDVGDAGTTKICCKIPYSSKIFAWFDWFYSEKKLGFSNETNWWIHKKAFNQNLNLSCIIHLLILFKYNRLWLWENMEVSGTYIHQRKREKWQKY